MKKLLCLVLLLSLCLYGAHAGAENTARPFFNWYEDNCVYSYAILEDDTVEILGWWYRAPEEKPDAPDSRQEEEPETQESPQISLLIKDTIDGHPVTSIGYRAFFLKSGLISVTIPHGVKTIENQAFGGCPDLLSVVIPDSVTRIGRMAFCYCTQLVRVNIPDSVTEIGKDAFGACYDLTITVSRGSYGEQYCIENGLRYRFAE